MGGVMGGGGGKGGIGYLHQVAELAVRVGPL